MTKVTHPNFRMGPGKGVSARQRAVMVYLSQEAYDSIMWVVAEGKASNRLDFIQKAIEQRLRDEFDPNSGSDTSDPA